jgi:hypothetical protein
MSRTNLTRKTRTRYRWSTEAKALVLANRNASKRELSGLVTQLVTTTGNPRLACWRFVRKLGGHWDRARRNWTLPEEKRLLALVEVHPIAEIAKIMGRTRHSIFSKLYELGANANMGCDWFSVNSLSQALHVQPAIILKWIERGWLKTRPTQSGKQRRFIILADDFCKFCKRHAKDVVGRRLSLARLEFVHNYVFPPSHASLLAVRESKKERAAYDSQMDEVQEQPEVEDKEQVAVEFNENPHRFRPGSDVFPGDLTGEICA